MSSSKGTGKKHFLSWILVGIVTLILGAIFTCVFAMERCVRKWMLHGSESLIVLRILIFFPWMILFMFSFLICITAFLCAVKEASRMWEAITN